MDWQQLVSLVIVAAAAGGLLSRALRRRKFSFARDTHCGCSGGNTGQQGSIVFRARKGCRPEVVVKMR
jgi:GTPase involved in cell partitioning and DNA repair